MERMSKKLSKPLLNSSSTDLTLRAFAELRASDGMEEKLGILKRKDGGYSVSHMGGVIAESESLSMISSTDIAHMDGLSYATKRLIFVPRRSPRGNDIKYAATGFTESIADDNNSKVAVIDTYTGEQKNPSDVLVGGNAASLLLMRAAGKNPESEIYVNYGEGGLLGSFKLEFSSEKISPKTITDAFLQGYNSGRVVGGIEGLIGLAEENFEDYVCIVHPGLSLRSSESMVNQEGQMVSKENEVVISLPTYAVFYSKGTPFITPLSKATPSEKFRNSVFKIRRGEIREASNARPYLAPDESGAHSDMYG